MRARTAPENTILSAAHRWHSIRVEVKDAAGAWQDWSAYLIGASWGADVDQPIAEARVRFRRDSGANSLSPLRGDSPLNAGGAAIDAGREIRISPATSAHGVAPISGDYKLLFLGTIDSVDFANSTMEVVARDQGGALVDAWIEADSVYGRAAGMPLQDVMQEILTSWAPGVTLYTPADPGFMVLEFDQPKASVYETIRSLAGLIGWDVRYLWDDSTTAFRLTLFEPDRAKTVPDWTFTGARYFDVTQLAISRENVRNYIVVHYTNAATGERETAYAADVVSTQRFGYRWLELEEASDSPIDTAVEAQALADAARDDLSWPIAEQEIELPFFWPVDIGDLIRFTANTVHTDGDLDLAVTGYQHELAPGRERTRIAVRGKPAGFYKDWLRRGNSSGRSNDEVRSALSLQNFREVSRDVAAGTIDYDATPGADVFEVWEYQSLVANPPTSEPWPDASSIPTAITPRSAIMTWTFTQPPQGYLRYVQLEPRSATLAAGPVQRLILTPTLDPPDHIVSIVVLVFDDDGSVSVRVDAAEKTLSYRYAWSIFALGASPSGPSDAAVEAGTVRTISGSDTFTLPAGTVDYNQALRVRAAPYIYADGTGTDGASDHGEIRAAEDIRLMPPVSLEITTETSNTVTGTFGVTVRDAGGYSLDLYYRTQAAGLAPGAWTLKSSSPTDGVEYQHTITEEEGHPVYIEFRLDYEVVGGAGEVHQKSNGFDKGKIPNIYVTPYLEQDGDASAFVISDVDTLSIKIAASVAGYPSAATVRAATAINGRMFTPATIGTLLTATIGQVVYIAAFGYSGAAGTGIESTALAVAQVTRVAPVMPKVSAALTGTGITRTLTLTVDDPLLKVTSIDYSKREAGGSPTAYAAMTTVSGTIGVNTALVRSATVTVAAIKDSQITWRVTFTDENGNAKELADTVSTSNMAGTTVTLRITSHKFVPQNQTDQFTRGPDKLLVSGGVDSGFYTTIDIPAGAGSITAVRARMWIVGGGGATVELFRMADTFGSHAVLATLNHSGAAGYETVGTSITPQLTNGYSFAASFVGLGTGGDVALLWFEIDFLP